MGRLESKDLMGHERGASDDRFDISRKVPGMDLSGVAGCRENRIRSLENGVCEIDQQSMAKIASILGVSSSWLSTGVGSGPEVQNADEDMINFMRWELERLTRMHDETAAMIQTLHRRISDLEQDSRI